MSLVNWPEKVLFLFEGSDFGGDFDVPFVRGFEEFGCEVTCLSRGQRWSDPFDLVMGYGPFALETGSLVPVANQLLKLNPNYRPVFVWWLTEGIPNPRMPDWMVNLLSKWRLKVDRIVGNRMPAPRNRWQDLLLKGHRLRVFGELNWVRQKGLLDVLAITSLSRVEYYRRAGFDPIAVPLGYHRPTHGFDQGLARDIEVGFLGNTSDPRRQRILPKLVKDLVNRGINVVVENQLYDEARNDFLNRCQILLNILRAPQDFVGQRFLLGAANKTLVISETVQDSRPFVPGEHFISVPWPQIPEKVQFYLSKENERKRIVDQAYQLIDQGELAIKRSVSLILQRARQARSLKMRSKER